MNTDESLIRAHEFSKSNKTQLAQDQLCGCYYCLRTFRSGEITQWYGDHDDAAVCPNCGIDAVIGEGAKLPITKEFLRQMRQYWFTESD
jgi:hypothetical protein